MRHKANPQQQSVPPQDGQAYGYPGIPQGYPPEMAQPGFPGQPAGIVPPMQGNVYPPQMGVNPPMQGNVYPPQSGVNPPIQGNVYPPQMGVNPPMQGNVYPPQMGANPPMQGMYPEAGYPPQVGAVPPAQGPYDYPPQNAPYAYDPNAGYPPEWMNIVPNMVPPTPEKPPKRPRKARKKRAKSASPALRRMLIILLAVAAVGFAGWMVWRSMMSSRPTTATVQMGTLGNTYRGDALIVRNETAYDDEGVMNIEYVAAEGSVVYRGDIVCYVYSTGYSSKELSTLQDYRDQIKDYQRTLLKAETASDQKMTRLENEVVERGLEVRNLVQGARGNLTNQEDILSTAITQRQNYFRTKYSTDMRLSRLYDDESTQLQHIDSWIKQRAAAQESIISFYTDGFEYALTPDLYLTYTPAQVRSMINGVRPERSTASRGRTDIYRLIKKNNYAVLMLIKDNSWNPVDGATYKLMLEQFSNTVVDATVLSSSRSGGDLLVRLAVVGEVTPVLYMRTCNAEIGEYVDSLLVPARALFTQYETRGVVLITQEGQTFVPVNVHAQQGDMVYVTPIQTGTLTEGQTVRLFY